jgi:prepilin-type N-terminal cleavage/methylation domain-containing protein
MSMRRRASTTAIRLRSHTGFSLIELMATVSLFGVIGLVAATNFRALVPSLRARGAALVVAGDMNQARLAAVRESRIYDLLPLAGTSYQIRRADGLGGMEVVKQVNIVNEFDGVAFAKTGVGVDPYGNDVSGAAAAPAGPVVFHSNGTVQNPAGFFVEADSGDGYAQQAVTVTAAGRIRVWRYDGAMWE